MTVVHEVRAYGPRALLVVPAGGVSPAAFAAAARSVPGVTDVVPGAATVVVVAGTGDVRERIADGLTTLSVAVGDGGRAAGPDVVIDVVYDGDDLATVADAAGLSVEEVVAVHSGAEYRCAFCGFAPGFAYLGGLDPRLVLPRRSTPRTVVPAGSVAIAGPYSAVYPSASPGGWHLLGHTDVELFDAGADPPALVPPGATVRFRCVPQPGRRVVRERRPSTTGPLTGGEGGRVAGRVLVVSAGIASTLQDRGRPGYAHLGVPHSGTLDHQRAGVVNRLVGNGGDEAVIETAGGLVLEAIEPVVVADSASGAVQSLRSGDRVAVDAGAGELYAYVAVRGGFDVAPVLGSRSWDSLSKLGPQPLERGDELKVGPDPGRELTADLAPPGSRPTSAVGLWPGPRLDWFADGALDRLRSTPWTVSTNVSRVGVRLNGPSLARHPARRDLELPSEGLVTGAVQVPPDGQPVIMLADHPTTGGYPVIATVDESGLPVVAQLRPGSTLTFTTAPPRT